MSTTRRAQHSRVIALTALWAISFGCMVEGTFHFGADDDPTQRAWFSWGLYLAMVAVIISGWTIVSSYARRERLRLEALARIMAIEAGRHRGEPEGGKVVSLR